MIITTGLGLLSWMYLIVPNFQADGLTGVQRFISVAYPLGDVLVLAMLARLVGGGGARIRSMQFLTIGAVGLILADVFYGLIQLKGGWAVGGPVDIGWAVFYVCWGCAALDPSMVRLSEVAPARGHQMGAGRLVLLASTSLIAPTVLFTEARTGGHVHATTVAVFSAALFLLVIARLWGILHEHQLAVRRERVLRASSESLVAAQGLPDIYRIALEAVRALVGPKQLGYVGIFANRDDELICVSSSGDTTVRPDWWQDAVTGGRLSTSGMTSVTPLRYDLDVRGMLVVAAQTPMTLDQHGALSMVATQVGLAVESARLAADLRQRQSEARFRGILQNTADIIVIVNARGEIIYGTPSLARTLGCLEADLAGRKLTAFLKDDDAMQAVAMFEAFAAGTTTSTALADWHLRSAGDNLTAFEVLSNNLLEDPSVGGIVLTMRDVSERREFEAQLKHQAFHDALTGLPNRALFLDRAERALARAGRRSTLTAMVMLDLDDFKLVNDTRGHAAGDELLLQLAQRLRSTLRAEETVARFGGDEFAILVDDLVDVHQAERVVERALLAFGAPFSVRGEDLSVRASIGLVLTGGNHAALDLTELMRCADLALYAAKERGKGQVVRYHPDMNTRMVDRLSRCSDLDAGSALKSSLFISSRSSLSRPVKWQAARRWSAGNTPPTGWCLRWSSWISPRTPA